MSNRMLWERPEQIDITRKASSQAARTHPLAVRYSDEQPCNTPLSEPVHLTEDHPASNTT